jgi:hypothetical protein
MRASHLAHEFGIDIPRWGGTHGGETRLLRDERQDVEENCAALGAATAEHVIPVKPGLISKAPGA